MAEKRVSIRPYAEGDIWVLERTLGDPSQMVHLNGEESPGKIQERHTRFMGMSADPSPGRMFTVMVGGDPAGNVGYWETVWEGQKAWETGWFVLPEFQGRGVATEATKLVIGVVRILHSYGYLFAFPSVNNGPSNAIARKLGFTLAGAVDAEYPYGSGKSLRCNVWRLALQST